MEAIIDLSQLDLTNGRYSYADYLTWQFEQTVELIKGHVFPLSAPAGGINAFRGSYRS